MSKEHTINEIMEQLKDHERRILELETRSRKTPEEGTKKLSIKEFILTSKPASAVQKTLAIGYFLETYDGCASFRIADLENGFRAAKEPVPANMNDMVNKNIAKGHMMEAKEKKENKKAWVLTNSGEAFVAGGFKGKK